MKIKFLALAMIAMLFTACKPDPQGGEGTDPNKGEIENSYIAISIASADKERGSDSDGFDEGSADERAVESAFVFFFTDGAPFTGATNTYNYQEIGVDSLNTFEGSTGNVSDYSQKVLVIRNYKGELPNQMVAVLNWRPEQHSYSISDLKGALNTALELKTIVANKNDNGKFIMSNSVYKNAAEDVYATPLAITDFKESATLAKQNPVQVYVERVAAKVIVNTPKDPTNHRFALLKKAGISGNLETDVLKIDGQQVYAKILGWELYNENNTSNLLKNIDNLPGPNDNTTYGFYWNDAPNHRSYWASNTQTPTDQINSDYDNIVYPTHLYCGENTSDNHTTVVLKAQLQYENGQPMEVAKWFGTEYVGRNQLINAVKNTLVTTYYSQTADGKYESITTDDLMIVNGTGEVGDAKIYQVYFQLKTGETGIGADKTWFKRIGDTFTQIDDNSTLDTEIKTNVGTALLYPNGDTYYFTEIEHFGSNEKHNYGVVRNHVYNININSISGYGTPVISDIIDEPQIPLEDKETFVSAQINILSWKIVENNVNL